jgi:hypothetical protein
VVHPGRAVYVPPGWAHRSINTGDTEDLATLFTYPAHAGHDYGTIERHGFRKRVVSADGGYRVIDNKTRPTMYSFGVTTAQSSIMKVFPLWMKELGREEVVMEGVDFPLHDDPRNYRRAVAQIKYDPLSLGALVTTHKVNLLEAAPRHVRLPRPLCGHLRRGVQHIQEWSVAGRPCQGPGHRRAKP